MIYRGKFEKIYKQLFLDQASVQYYSQQFYNELQKGLNGEESSLKMLPSFLSKPNGTELGTFIALDFGGSNVRAYFVELLGKGKYQILRKISQPLKDSRRGYDYTSSSTCAEELFDFISSMISKMVNPDEELFLGHTFSFPVIQKSIHDAELLEWTKEIKTSGVNKPINCLLSEALNRHNLPCIKPVALINDTVAVLLAKAYQNNYADIGSICGTGHNTCYFESGFPGLQPMIINLESGNFNKLPFSIYDEALDKESDLPGAQRFEKMLSGKYIGEILRFIIQNIMESSEAGHKQIIEPNSIMGEHIAAILSDNSNDLNVIADIFSSLSLNMTLEQRKLVKDVALLLIDRSAKLLAASYSAIIAHMDPRLNSKHLIAIDGSIFRYMPHYIAKIQEHLLTGLDNPVPGVTLELTHEGSAIGAAVAAALATKTSG
jgi:hexokinase